MAWAAPATASRWHRIERWPGRYDWSSALPLIQAARDSGMTVIWDLLHYGVPNDIDVFSPAFVDRFAAFARCRRPGSRRESDAPLLITPVNEISFWAFAGGETGGLNPFARGRGDALEAPTGARCACRHGRAARHRQPHPHRHGRTA